MPACAMTRASALFGSFSTVTSLPPGAVAESTPVHTPDVHECTPLCTLPHTGHCPVSFRCEQHQRMRTTDEARSLLASWNCPPGDAIPAHQPGVAGRPARALAQLSRPRHRPRSLIRRSGARRRLSACWPTTRPSRRSSASASRTTVLDTPYRCRSCAMDGNWAPGSRAPVRICVRRSSATCKYAGIPDIVVTSPLLRWVPAPRTARPTKHRPRRPHVLSTSPPTPKTHRLDT